MTIPRTEELFDLWACPRPNPEVIRDLTLSLLTTLSAADAVAYLRRDRGRRPLAMVRVTLGARSWSVHWTTADAAADLADAHVRGRSHAALVRANAHFIQATVLQARTAWLMAPDTFLEVGQWARA